jgi:hypothetical protein
MPKHSIILLDYDPEEKLVPMRTECKRLLLESLRGVDCELIVANKKGFEAASKEAFEKAKGEYIHVVCNDVMVYESGWPDKLAVPDTVTAYAEVPCTILGTNDLALDLWCTPRNIYEKVGTWDELAPGGYGFHDWSLLARVRKAGFKTAVVPVNAKHLAASVTFKTYSGNSFEDRMQRNKEAFKAQYPELEPVGGWKQ